MSLVLNLQVIYTLRDGVKCAGTVTIMCTQLCLFVGPSVRPSVCQHVSVLEFRNTVTFNPHADREYSFGSVLLCLCMWIEI